MLRLLCLAGLAFAAVACGDDGVSADEATVVRGSTPGVLTQVQDAQLTLDPEGEDAEATYAIRQVDVPRLDLFHLRDHVRQKWPVVVFWEDVDGTRYAVRVDDA